jgi:hypothetical protein
MWCIQICCVCAEAALHSIQAGQLQAPAAAWRSLAPHLQQHPSSHDSHASCGLMRPSWKNARKGPYKQHAPAPMQLQWRTPTSSTILMQPQITSASCALPRRHTRLADASPASGIRPRVHEVDAGADSACFAVLVIYLQHTNMPRLRGCTMASVRKRAVGQSPLPPARKWLYSSSCM